MDDDIVALATPAGQGAIAVIRCSGPQVIDLADGVFFGKNLKQVAGGTTHYGKIKDDEGNIIDECMATVFQAPRSYTRENAVEISCHGSPFIVQEIIRVLLARGMRLALPGEYTQRAFLNGQLDLSQAEAVADLIASQTREQHRLALTQLRGGVTHEIKSLRKHLLEFASLIELENDFGEEDVAFADRDRLRSLAESVLHIINALKDSFRFGRAIKEGVPVVIVGKPNVGKSTLLNALLGDEKAIVSAIPGTTRDVIEDRISIDGILFRFIDTAGLRQAEDEIEKMGIERSYDQLAKAQLVLHLLEIEENADHLVAEYSSVRKLPDQAPIILLNKIDEFHECHSYDVEEAVSTLTGRTPTIAISAKTGRGLDRLRKEIVANVKSLQTDSGRPIINNLRHYEALDAASESMDRVLRGLKEEIPSDLVAIDIRHALHHLGEITGEISTDDLLGEIFSNFCIGK
ncbi:MAG: tRNA uridine-5-carboxymethylaminomethyl(34) synthesis GTPase MnmE [Saprospiraceae bacterium]|nr:tRNA uridine-5-carboxymethylaminomethyl(34) synthesis GTPase MnmE [Saprospiraceae bacterium]